MKINSKEMTNKKTTKKVNQSQKPDKVTTTQIQLSDLDTADSDSSFCSESDFQTTGSSLKDNYFVSLLICFTGVISCYTGYAVLQESL